MPGDAFFYLLGVNTAQLLVGTWRIRIYRSVGACIAPVLARSYRRIICLLGALGMAKVAASPVARALLPLVAYVLVMVICVDRERAELIILLVLASSWSGLTDVFGCLPCGRAESFAAQPGSVRRRLVFGV